MANKQYPIKFDPTYQVVTANDLIKGRQKMTLREAQLLFIAISQVLFEDKDLKTYTTTVPELAAFMGIDENSLYRDLESICTSLLQRVVKIQIGGDNAKEKKKWEIFQWVNKATYYDGKLTIRLSDDIKPYLVELEEHYAQPFLGSLMMFRSYYTIRLYQYLIAVYGQNKKRIEQWNFTCEQLRELFQIGDKQYPRNYDLVRYTIKPALKEMHETNLAYVSDYEEHRAAKRGRPLVSVSFKLSFCSEIVVKHSLKSEYEQHKIEKGKKELMT